MIEDDTAVQHDPTHPSRPSRGAGIAREGDALWRAAMAFQGGRGLLRRTALAAQVEPQA